LTQLLALLGSGEFEPWTEEIDRWLLHRASGEGTVLILPAASAPEGDEVFNRWANMGLRHHEGLGIPAEVLPLKTKEDGERPELWARLSEASVAYFSGGNPAYLAGVLSGSRFWSALMQAMDRGLAYVGCSAGAACLGELVPDSTVLDFTSPDLWRTGLGYLPGLDLAPHWDGLDTYLPGLRDLWVSAVPADHRLLAIDERTALVGDGSRWHVVGGGGAYLLEGGTWRSVRSGEAFVATFRPDDESSASA
jgi:cyanophycinase-like exopeptidase